MATLRKEPAKDGPVVLLVLSCPERQARLATILHALGVDLLCVRQCWEASALLQTRPPLLSVVTDATLADGNWRDVLRTVVDYDPQAGVILVAPSSADEMLWSEAMWLGVHDILVEPCTETEAQQVVESVLRVAAQQHSLIGNSRGEQAASGNTVMTLA